MQNPLSHLSREHLDSVRDHYEREAGNTLPAALGYRRLLAHYYRLLIPSSAKVLEIGCGRGDLLKLLPNREVWGIDLSAAQIARAKEAVPGGHFSVQAGEELQLDEKFDCIIISDTLNFAADVQLLLEKLQAVSTPDTRLILNIHSALWRPVLAAASAFGARGDHPQSSWLSTSDLRNLLALADWEPVRFQSQILAPIEIPFLTPLLNRWIAPLLPILCLCIFCVARSTRRPAQRALKVSVVVPARNEAGNIEAAVRRTPEMGAGTELIFVEGNSTDNTWDEIQRIGRDFPDRDIKILQQPGRGKGDAVRAGYAVATGEVLMILDADLTVPPEELPKFYDVIASGRGEFANGVRLVYPMDKEAMRFLNLCANKFFSLAFSWLLGQTVKDTLCGTKVLTRDKYDRVAAGRTYFGDFDPFGDFDLLFGANKLNLKIADVPIRYRERTYGTTNIHRWSHGLLLFRMVGFAAKKLKFI